MAASSALYLYVGINKNFLENFLFKVTQVTRLVKRYFIVKFVGPKRLGPSVRDGPQMWQM